MTRTTYTNSDQTHGPHGFLEWATTCPKSLKKDRNEHENYSIVTPLLFIIPILPKIFREDFVSTTVFYNHQGTVKGLFK